MAAESHGQRNLAGHSPWGRKESDKLTEQAHMEMYRYWGEGEQREKRGELKEGRLGVSHDM